MNLNKLFLVLYSRKAHNYFTKYFINIKEMDKFIRRLFYSKDVFIIEDSRDIKFTHD